MTNFGTFWLSLFSSLNIDGVPQGATTSFGRILATLIRELFAGIDKMVIWVIDGSFDLLTIIADTNIFGEQIIQMFATRVYALIAIFMLFKIALSLIQYLANPDTFSDEKTGFGKLVSKIIIALVLLVAVPFLFSLAFEIQSFVLKNKTLERLIFGTTDTLGSDQSKMISFSLYSSFFYPDPKVVGDSCDGIYFYNEVPEGCLQAIKESSLANESDQEYVANVFNYAVQNQSAEILYSSILLGATNDENDFVFKYNWLISTVVGVLAALIIIGFCFDIAIRSVKLGFLQLIAPIPILSSIDPKSEIFKKWYEECFKTYLDLFVRLLAIFFAVFVIAVVKSNFGLTRFSDGTPIDEKKGLVMLFIIIGSLLFAKQFPELLSNMLGVKFDGGGFSLNPINRVKQTPVLGKATGAAFGGAGGFYGGWKGGKDADASLYGAIHGMSGGIGAGTKGIGWGGAEPGKAGESVFGAGMQRAYKDMTGSEMSVLSTEQMFHGISERKATKKMIEPKERLAQIEEDQTFIEREMAIKTKEYHKIREEEPASGSPEYEGWSEREVSARGKLINMRGVSKSLKDSAAVYEDQIKDIKKTFKVDDSTKVKLSKADEKAQEARSKLVSDYGYTPTESGDSTNDSEGSGGPSTPSTPSTPTTPSSSDSPDENEIDFY